MDTIGKIVAGVLTAGALTAGVVLLAPPEGLATLEAWVGVVAGDVENRIDTLLGEEEVLRQRAQDAMQDAENDIGRLQDLAVTSRVDAELLGEKLAVLQGAEAQSKRQLGQLAQLVETGQAITLDGTTWQQADLAAYAETKITEHAAIQERIRVYEESRRIQSQTAARAESALRVAQQNVANMRASLELLDAKLALLAALQAEPTAFVGQNVTVDTVLGDTESLVQSLMDEVEREIRIAEERGSVQRRNAGDAATPLPDFETDDLAGRLFALAEQQ